MTVIDVDFRKEKQELPLVDKLKLLLNAVEQGVEPDEMGHFIFLAELDNELVAITDLDIKDQNFIIDVYKNSLITGGIFMDE